eukprot:CAMPEP_0115858466 /NCGR_PEP_ID=MMETSP0287-20121206/16113_1 /TAXON_ID=412157 /ORGANISM="Chrysochromulina rotalis, Strain UIO044" /LENGTH=94 /DNA_ID=CAMNT_0003312733 /DNA_START=220 /DNA_END=505 /DNA_ORIENTATION=+
MASPQQRQDLHVPSCNQILGRGAKCRPQRVKHGRSRADCVGPAESPAMSPLACYQSSLAALQEAPTAAVKHRIQRIPEAHIDDISATAGEDARP